MRYLFKRILDILSKKIQKLRAFLREMGLRLKIGKLWIHHESNQSFKRRVYRTYEDYTTHQKSKLDCLDLSNYDIEYREALRKRLEKLDFLRHGMTVLCLAARIGTEVKSFLDIGCLAIGIDLNPGENNRYVVYGDFHDIQFPSNSVDVIFTNSLDHTFNIEKLIDETKRVLKPNGFLIVEAIRGDSEGIRPAFYESFSWSKIDDLVSLFENFQFRLIKRFAINFPHNGEQLCLRKRSESVEAGALLDE